MSAHSDTFEYIESARSAVASARAHLVQAAMSGCTDASLDETVDLVLELTVLLGHVTQDLRKAANAVPPF
jgi:hypothetical protein